MASISQAAAEMGCSTDTIRRRIRAGEINAKKVRGMWDVELPEDTKERPTMAVDALQAIIEVLRTELDAKNLQIQQLHQLLATPQLRESRRSPRWQFWR